MISVVKTYEEAVVLVDVIASNYSPWMFSEVAHAASKYRDIHTNAENAVAMSLMMAAYRNYRSSEGER